MKKNIVFSLLAVLSLGTYTMAEPPQNAENTQAEVGFFAPRELDLQQRVNVSGTDYQFQSGDTVVLMRHTPYLTGEMPSKWVYYVKHIVLKNGGKRFPEGILIADINSWCDPASVYLFRSISDSPEAEERRLQDQKEIAATQEEMTSMSDAQLEHIRQNAQAYGVEVLQTSAEVATHRDTSTTVRTSTHSGMPRVEYRYDQRNLIPCAITTEQRIITTSAPAGVAGMGTMQTADASAAQNATATSGIYAYNYPTQAQLDYSYQVMNKPRTIMIMREPVPVMPDTTPLQDIDRFTIGVRGGMASPLAVMKRGYNLHLGYSATLDLQYAHYWQTEERVYVGLLTGVSVGFMSNRMDAAKLNYATTKPSADGQINYTITASKVQETANQVSLEVPLMFALTTPGGFFFNIGPKFRMPLCAYSNLHITDGFVNAYFPAEGVNVPNEVITGRLDESNSSVRAKWHPAMHVLAGVELGYEHTFKSGHGMCIGVYGNYNCYSYRNATGLAKSLIDVVPPAAGTPAQMLFASQMDAAISSQLSHFDAGVKLAFHFNWYHQKENK